MKSRGEFSPFGINLYSVTIVTRASQHACDRLPRGSRVGDPIETGIPSPVAVQITFLRASVSFRFPDSNPVAPEQLAIALNY